jgi:hypothetical protein
MAAKLTRLSYKIVIQLDLVAESCTIYSSPASRPVRKLLDTPSYTTLYTKGCDLIRHVKDMNQISKIDQNPASVSLQNTN